MNRQELTVYRRTLARAVEIAGNERRLAEFLGLSIEHLQDWAAGRSDPPLPVFLALLDIVASNSLTTQSLANLQRLTSAPPHRWLR